MPRVSRWLTKVAVPTLEGQVTVKIPPGTQNGKTLRVRGKGAPLPKGGTGDLLVTVEVQVPTRLSKQERESLEHFATLHKASPRPHIDEEIATATRDGRRREFAAFAEFAGEEVPDPQSEETFLRPVQPVVPCPDVDVAQVEDRQPRPTRRHRDHQPPDPGPICMAASRCCMAASWSLRSPASAQTRRRP